MTDDQSPVTSLLAKHIDRRKLMLGTAAGAIALSGVHGSLSATAQEGSSIIIGTLGNAFSLNPFAANESESYWRSYMLFDQFVRLDPTTLAPAPGLAASWDIDGAVFTFHIQPNAKFQDGTDLTADDVKFTIEGIMTPETASENSGRFAAIYGSEAIMGPSGGASTPAAGTPAGTPAATPPGGGSPTGVAGIEVVDAKTLRITLARPDSSFLYNLSFVFPVPKAQLEGQSLAKDSTAPFFQKPVGAGAYVFGSLDNSTNEFKATANPNFWETGKPAIQNLTHTVIADSNTLANALQSGDINGSLYASPTLKDQLEALGTLDVVVPPFGAPNGTVFNCRVAPLDNVEVRRAIAMAVNVDQYVQDSLLGLGKAGLGPIAPNSWAFDPNLKPIPYDPEAAKAIIDKNGLAGTQLELITNAGNTLREDWSIRLQADLKAIGLTVNFNPIEYATVVNRITQTHEFTLDTGDFAGAGADPNDLFNQFHSTGVQNVTGFHTPELDALLEQARITLDQNAAKEIWSQIQQILMDQVPMHWAWYRPFTYAIDKKYTGYTLSNNNGGIFYTLPNMTITP